MAEERAQVQAPVRAQEQPPKWARIVADIHEVLSRRGAGVSLVFDNLDITLGEPGGAAPPARVRLNGRLTVEARDTKAQG